MKHLSKFQAHKVADYVRSQYSRIEYADMIANQIEQFADATGMVYHFAVSDTIGPEWMREIESECVMYMEGRWLEWPKSIHQ
jgi:hypothetical protein